MSKQKRELSRAINPIMINPYDGNDLLLNICGYEPYIDLEELLIIKGKLEKSIEFAINNNVGEENSNAVYDYINTANYRRTKKQTNKKRTRIYLMVDHNTGFYKIGRSKSPLEREKTLQSEKPTIELISHWESVESHENWLHQKFKNKRIRGEWFALSKEDVDFILENIQVNI